MKNEIIIEPISALTTNIWKFRIVVTAIKLNVFDVTQNTHKLKELSEELELNLNPLERLLNALVAMELLEKKENSYFNKPISTKFLTKNSKEYYGDFILMNEDLDDSWKQLDIVINRNSPVVGDNRQRLAQERFTKGMHNNAQAPANALSEVIISVTEDTF